MRKSLIIAVDFDGTLVEDEFPAIGKPLTFAFETIKQLQKDGHRIILWTYRSGKALDEAVEFCKQKGVEFYAVNESFPNEILKERESRKINADIFIDGRNLGGLAPWGEMYQAISQRVLEVKENKRSFFNLFKI